MALSTTFKFTLLCFVLLFLVSLAEAKGGGGSSGGGSSGGGGGGFGGSSGGGSRPSTSSTKGSANATSPISPAAILGMVFGLVGALGLCATVLVCWKGRCCCFARRSQVTRQAEEMEYASKSTNPDASEYSSYQNASNEECRRGTTWLAARGIVDSPTSSHGDGVPTPEQLSEIAELNSVTKGSAFSFDVPALVVPGMEVPTCLPADSVSPHGLLPQHVITFPNPEGQLINRSLLSKLPLVPLSNPRMIYYEITILDLFTSAFQLNSTVVAFGLSTAPYPDFRLPGWHAHSIAYHSDDGRLFVSDSFGGRIWQAPYGVGDTVGVGALLKIGGGFEGFFFTKNGRLLSAQQGTGETESISEALVTLWPHQRGMLNKVLYASIGADVAAQIGVNFGERPFAWEVANGANEVY